MTDRENILRELLQRGKLYPYLTANDLEEDLTDCGWFVNVLLCSHTCTNMTIMVESSEKKLSCVIGTKFCIRSLQRNIDKGPVLLHSVFSLCAL